MKIRHTAAFALCALFAAASAQSAEQNANSRQERMDSAYANWQHTSGASHDKTTHHHAARHAEHHSGAKANATVGESLSQYGHSFVADVKKAPHQLAEAGRETGHAIADAGREQGHEAKTTAGKAKKAVTGEGS